MEPPNKGQLGIRAGVLYSEAVSNWEVIISTLKISFIIRKCSFNRHEMCEYTLTYIADCSVIDNNLFSRAFPEDNQH